MVASSGFRPPTLHQLHDEAAVSAVQRSPAQHAGATTDRYHGALIRYLDAVAGDRYASRPQPQRPRPPATLVEDVMTRAVIAVGQSTPFKEIVAALARNRIRALPVTDQDGAVVGVVSASDLLSRVVAGPVAHTVGKRVRSKTDSATTAGEFMSAPPVTIRPHDTIVEAARKAARARVRTLPVVDRAGVLVGIVSQGDLLRVFLRDDDEIRDDIVDFARRTMHAGPTSLTVDVEEGVVSLTGKLQRQLQVAQLLEHVRRVSGVVEVENLLTARYDDRYFPAPHGAR